MTLTPRLPGDLRRIKRVAIERPEPRFEHPSAEASPGVRPAASRVSYVDLKSAPCDRSNAERVTKLTYPLGASNTLGYPRERGDVVQ